MKKILLLLVVVCIGQVSWAQYLPQSISYQAVASDAKGLPIANEEVVVEISIIKQAADGEIVWQEVHYPVSNDFGVFSVNIGLGESTFGGSLNSFQEIAWAEGPHYLRTRVDYGKSNVLNGFIDMGTIQFLSVPYALLAQEALKAPIPNLLDLKDVDASTLKTDDVLKWNGTKWVTSLAIDPTIYLKRDGSTDLTADWTIDTKNINLNYGNVNLLRGKLISNEVVSKKITLNAKTISDLRIDPTFATVDDNSIASSKAIRDYVNSKTSAAGDGWIVSGNSVYNLDKRIGVGTIPQYKFHSNVADDVFYVEGNQSLSANFPNLDIGTYMIFFPGKSALRVGTIETSIDAWDDDQVGQFSQAFGKDTKASADYSTAFGFKNIAAGRYSVAFGQQNTIDAASYSLVAGYKNSIIGGGYSAAFGQENEVQGYASFAFGSNNIVYADNSMAMGELNKTGLSSGGTTSAFACGINCNTRGNYSFAYGNGAKTGGTAEGGVAFGKNTEAYAAYSLVHGENTSSSSYLEVTLGRNNIIANMGFDTWVPTDYLFVIGNGSSIDNPSNAFVVYKNGNTEVNGTLTVQGTAVSSDRRYKREIKPLSNSLSRILELDGVSYFWKQAQMNGKQFSADKQFGLIAQDVEKVFPELVITDQGGYKSVNYTALIPVLIEALKEQQKEIEALKTANKTKDTETASLNNKVESLNERLSAIERLLLQNTGK